MVVHRRRMRTRRVRRRGAGFMDALRSAHDWIKKNRLISTVANSLSKVGVPYAGSIGTAASALGYGRRRRVRRRRVVRRRRGGDIKSILSSAHKFVKDNRLISKGLRTFLPNSNLHKAAFSLGYGKRRRRVHRRRGGANFFSTEMIAAPKW